MRKSFKTISLLFVLVMGVIVLTGCDKEMPESFSIICEGSDNTTEGVKTTNKSVYNFNKEQLVTDYEISTVSVYTDEETYKIYKEGAEQTANSSTDGSPIKYTIKTDDKTKTVDFSYKATLTKEMYNEVEDKDYYKAVKVLERAESNPDAKCTFKGIERNQIK